MCFMLVACSIYLADTQWGNVHASHEYKNRASGSTACECMMLFSHSVYIAAIQCGNLGVKTAGNRAEKSRRRKRQAE